MNYSQYLPLLISINKRNSDKKKITTQDQLIAQKQVSIKKLEGEKYQFDKRFRELEEAQSSALLLQQKHFNAKFKKLEEMNIDLNNKINSLKMDNELLREYSSALIAVSSSKEGQKVWKNIIFELNQDSSNCTIVEILKDLDSNKASTQRVNVVGDNKD